MSRPLILLNKLSNARDISFLQKNLQIVDMVNGY